MFIKISLSTTIKASLSLSSLRNIQSYSVVMSKFDLPDRLKGNDKSVW